jgi:hypothetical protein
MFEIKNAFPNQELRSLSDEEVAQASGANLVLGIIVGVATNAIYDWLKSPTKMTNQEFLERYLD